MTEEAKAARRAYLRKWAKENPEKAKQHQAHYWQKKAAKAKEAAQQDGGQSGPTEGK